MKILGLSAKAPSRRVSNDDVVSILEQKSAPCFKGDLEKVVQEVSSTLEKSGIRNRFWFDKNEPWYPLMAKAIDEALEQAQLKKEDIDFVIYGSVFRRVLEPGMSTLISAAYGLHRAECMDLVEACAGWARSMQVAQNFLKGNIYKNILILNAEAGVHEGEYGHETFALENESDLEWSYPILTLGEAISATVVGQGQEDIMFKWASYPQYADLCSIALPDSSPEGNVLGDIVIRGDLPKKFRCFSKKMNTVGFKRMTKLGVETLNYLKDADVAVSHSHSHQPFQRALERFGVNIPLLCAYYEYGNVASCSFPLAMMDGQQKDILTTGRKLYFMMSAAGLSLGVMYMKF